jgi:hypothetical protein
MKYEVDNKFSFSQNDGRIHEIINSLQVGVLIHGPQSEILFSNKGGIEYAVLNRR